MIRLVDFEGRPVWINPKSIDSIGRTDVLNAQTGKQASVVIYHSGSSCLSIHMSETLDEVKKMIDKHRGE